MINKDMYKIKDTKQRKNSKKDKRKAKSKKRKSMKVILKILSHQCPGEKILKDFLTQDLWTVL